MAFNQKQQAAFERRINEMKEDGFFLPEIRSLSGDTRYLIISYGGTGADALFGVKKAFETTLSPVELDTRVRFLAIDTDSDTQKQTKKIVKPDGFSELIEVDALTNEQFFQLSGSAARLVYDTDSNVATWINPQLVEQIRENPELLSGHGASGTRQLGRLTLYPANNVNALTAKIKTAVSELTNDNHSPLRVFILTGIAGGTGSGTVVDLTYLVRNVLENMPGDLDSPELNVPTRVKYCGFVLLPPTGASTDPVYINRGNRNGYAALKEINHFMTVDSRNGGYELAYGNGNVIRSHKKIFDVCYLLDGTSDGVAFKNPRQKAIAVLSECMLDMVTSSQVADDGNTIQAVDSFMNDWTSTRTVMISGKPVAHAMRDADYVYCALGHSEFAMPSHEIKAYVAKQLFDRIYALFLRCANVEAVDAEEFLKRVIRKGVSTRPAVARAMDEEINVIFNNLAGFKGGPYYVINLLVAVSDQVMAMKNTVRMFRPGMVTDEALDNIRAYALQVNNSTFSVYTAVMSSIRDLLQEQFGVVVKVEEHKRVYSFIPQSLGSVEGAEKIIRYLDSLINSSHLNMLTTALLREMLNNRAAWTDLVESNNVSAAPAAIRRFWNDQLNRLIHSTLEDFMIKYFSGNPDASYSAENHNATLPYLQQAASTIYNQMLGTGGTAQPMAGFTGRGLTPNDFNGHTYLLVPECAPNLYRELKRIAANAPAGNAVNVCTSFASDRISCYRQYTGIPAFKLAWVSEAESNYEKDILTVAGVGVHMSETAGGNQWKNFPSLLPESTWSVLPRANYTNPREAALAKSARDLFDGAKALGLTTARHAQAGTPNLVYDVKVLSEEYRPGDDLFKGLDRSIEGSDLKRQQLAAIDNAAEACAEALFGKVERWTSENDVIQVLADTGVKFQVHDLHYPDSVLTVGPADHAPADWDEYMAKCMLRKMPDVMNKVKGTNMVMEKLMAKVRKSVQAGSLIKLFAQYLVADVFHYDENSQQWQYADADGFPKELAYIGSEIEKNCELYFMFNGFRDNSDAVIKCVTPKFNTIVPVPGCENRPQKARAFITASQQQKDKLTEWLMNPPINPYAQILNAMGYDVNVIRNFHRALFEELKIMALAGYIPVMTAAAPAEDPLAGGTNNYLF